MDSGTIVLGFLANYVIETIISYTVIDKLRNINLSGDDTVRTKAPEHGPKIKMKF